nr:MAG TPA: Minor capsid protein from bacteriophage [Caudoviricetes sp.]
MRTVSESVITWLKTFNPKEYRKMKRIETGILPADVDSYALVKEPIVNKKTSISGKVTATEYYTLHARLASQNNTDRIDNGAFGELLEAWVYEQKQMKNYPVIESGKVKGVDVTTPFYVGKTETNNSVYQLTISITYVKEN